MMWLKVNGCPWNYNTFYYAAGAGNSEALEWLKIKGCPMPNKFPAEDSLEDDTNGYRVEKVFFC